MAQFCYLKMTESYKRKRSPPARCPISVPNRSTRETSVTHSASIADVTESLTADSESHITEASEKTCGTPLNLLFKWAVRFAVVDVHTPQSQLNFGMVRCSFCQVYMRVHKQRDKLTRHEKSVLYTKTCKAMPLARYATATTRSVTKSSWCGHVS